MRGDRRFASSSPVALIVLCLFSLFTFYNPPNLGHLNNFCYLQIILTFFFVGSSESDMSFFMCRVYPVTDEHSSSTQRSATLSFFFCSQELTEEDKYLSQERDHNINRKKNGKPRISIFQGRNILVFQS